MSWSQWPVGATPALAGVINPAPAVINPSTGVINPAAAVMPVGSQYTPEQWTQMQQQNWQQWAQWQQQYQQWHQQYGAEYQKSMTAMNVQATPLQPPLPPPGAALNTGVPPPLPVDAKPPLPPDEPPPNMGAPPQMKNYSTGAPNNSDNYNANVLQDTNSPANRFDTRNTSDNRNRFNSFNSGRNNQSWKNMSGNTNQQHNAHPPSLLDITVAKPTFEQGMPKRQQNKQNNVDPKRNKVNENWQYKQRFEAPNEWNDSTPNSSASGPSKAANTEELSEAEKKFDKQFADWEAQFNKWKDQNAGHPDKVQYREYEKKWETWRAQLLERREQMRRKRLNLTSHSPNLSSMPGFNPSQLPNLQTNDKLSGSHSQPGKKIALLETPSMKPPNLHSEGSLIGPSFSRPPPNVNNDPLEFKKPPKFAEDLDIGFETKEFDTTFLKSASDGTIPGLDLVKDGENENQDSMDRNSEMDSQSQASGRNENNTANLEALSKGINSILGDQKLLSMLSMVSQNQNLNVADATVNTISNISQTVGRQDEKPYGGHSYEESEGFNAFDDQTRSSFTGGYGQHETRFENNNFDRGNGPNRGNPRMINDNRYNSFGDASSNFDQGNFGRHEGGPNFRAGPGKFPDNRPDNNFEEGNFGRNDRQMMHRDSGRFGGNSDNMPPAPEGPNFGKPGGFPAHRDVHRFDNNDTGRRFGDGNQAPDNIPRQADNFNRGFHNFEGPPPFERGGDNFNMPGNAFNRRPENFPNNFGRERWNSHQPESFGDGPGNANRGHGNFERFPGNTGNMGEPNFNQTEGPNQQFNRGPNGNLEKNNFRRDGNNFPRNLNDFRGDNFGRDGVPPFQRGPANKFDSGNLGRPFNQFGDGQNMHQRYPEKPVDYQNRFVEEPVKRPINFEPPASNAWSRSDSFYEEENTGVSNESNNFGPPKQQFPSEPHVNAPNMLPPTEPPKDDILKPATITDYDHKSLKTVEPEVIIEPVQTFDYRHKTVSRIPLPQRPKWLCDAVRHIREFEPLTTRLYEPLRRYDDWKYDDRKYDDRKYDDRRGYEAHYDDKKLTYPRGRQFENNPKFTDTRSNQNYSEKRGFEFDNRKGFERQADEDDDNYSEKLDFGNRKKELFKIHDNQQQFDRDSASNRFDNRHTNKPENKSVINRQDKVPERSNTVSINTSSSKVTSIDDLLSPPGRYNRPSRIVIILRGPPGSGKTFLAKLIKDKEVESGGSAPRILCLDDYFMVEQEKEIFEDGKRMKIKEMHYEYEECMEASYRESLMKSFKKTVTDGYFNFIIVDNVNDKVKYFGEMWSFAKQNGFQVYICQMDLDVQICTKRNIHGRTEAEIEKCVAGWETTPSHHPVVDATSLVQSGSIPEVEMEEINSPQTDFDSDDGNEEHAYRSKWDTFDCSIDNLAKLDGTSKPLKPSRTMEDFLQLDEWTPTEAKPGVKRVRWADLEERKEQEKMRAIGFVVGQTNWNRMMDPTMGSGALTQTKYIERVGRY